MNNDIIKYWATITESTDKQGYKNNLEYALDNNKDLSDADKLVKMFSTFLNNGFVQNKSLDDVSLADFAGWLMSKPDERIQYESQINEVSDVDVDWDDEILEKKIEQDYMKWAQKQSDLTLNDYIHVCSILEQCVDEKKLQDWLEYWNTHEPTSRKVADYLRARMKTLRTRDNVDMIKDIKDEEGI